MSASRMAFLRSALAPGLAMVAAALLWGANPLAYFTFGAWSQPQMPYVVNSANLDLPGIVGRECSPVGRRRLDAAVERIPLRVRRSQRADDEHATTTSTWSSFATRRARRSDCDHLHVVDVRTLSKLTSSSGMPAFQFFSGASGCSGGASTSRTSPLTSSGTRSASCTRQRRARRCTRR